MSPRLTIQYILLWALGLSWVPLAAASLAAAMFGQCVLAAVIAVLLIVWLIKLAEMFNLFAGA